MSATIVRPLMVSSALTPLLTVMVCPPLSPLAMYGLSSVMVISPPLKSSCAGSSA